MTGSAITLYKNNVDVYISKNYFISNSVGAVTIMDGNQNIFLKQNVFVNCSGSIYNSSRGATCI